MKFTLIFILVLALTSVLAVPASDKKDGEPKPKKTLREKIFGSKAVKEGKKTFKECSPGMWEGKIVDCLEKTAQAAVTTASQSVKGKYFKKDYSDRLLF